MKKELANIEELTGEDVNLDIQWAAFMTSKYQEIGKHGKAWIENSIKEAKEAYELAIKEIERVESAHREKKAKPMLRSTMTSLQKDIEDLDAKLKDLNKEIETTKTARKDLQAAVGSATRRKATDAIAKAKEALKANNSVLTKLKQLRRENQWDRNAKAREIELQFPDAPGEGPQGKDYGVKAIKKELEEGRKILLGFEKKAKDLKLPALGSQMAMPIRPGGS